MKDIKKILAEIEGDYKPEYGIVLSILPYATYYNKPSVIIELRKRAAFFEKDEDKINQLVLNSINELDDIYIEKMGEKYGEHDDLKYTCASYSLNRRILEDSCRGICLVNSLKSHEYLNMNSKDFGTIAKNILKLINSKFLNNEKYDNDNFEDIVDTEQENLVYFKQNRYKKKVVNYIPLIKKWKEIAEKDDLKNNRTNNTVYTIKNEGDAPHQEAINNTNTKKIVLDNLVDELEEEFSIKKNTVDKEIYQPVIEENENKIDLIVKMIGYRILVEINSLTAKAVEDIGNYHLVFFKKEIDDQNSLAEDGLQKMLRGNKSSKNGKTFNKQKEMIIKDFLSNVSKGFLRDPNNNQSEFADFIINCNQVIRKIDFNARLDSYEIDELIKKEIKNHKTWIFMKEKEQNPESNKERIYEKIYRISGLNSLIDVAKKELKKIFKPKY